MLSRRLHQLVAEGLLERTDEEGVVTYYMTGKGEDAVYVLLALLRFGIRYHMKKPVDYEMEDVMTELHYQSPFGPLPPRH